MTKTKNQKPKTKNNKLQITKKAKSQKGKKPKIK